MIELSPERIAAETGGEIVREGGEGRAQRAVVDSREVGPGDLFVGLRGTHADGSEFTGEALAAGAWGAIIAREWARSLELPPGGWVFAVADPLDSLQRLARAWRRELGARVVAITGSTGKTSVKDICHALLPGRVHASPENYNTEIGLPLAILSAPQETDVLVLEMAMRGVGQIAKLCEIGEPTVAAITNIGPVHLELLGTIEAIAATKAEILAGLRDDGRAVIPAGEEALEPHLDDRVVTLTFGLGGDVFAERFEVGDTETIARVGTPHGEQRFRFPFTEAYHLTNALCAVAIGVALDAPLDELSRRAPGIGFSRLRGERIRLPNGAIVINDCYNANPVSMRAALDHLVTLRRDGRAVAVLGGMAELGPDGRAYHREVGAHARGLGIGPIVGVGELARDYAPDQWAPDPDAAAPLVADLLGPGDVVLIKGSRSVGLERLTDRLRGSEA